MIEITYKEFTFNNEKEKISNDRFIIDQDTIYVFHENSTAVLTLKLDKTTKKIYDAADNSLVGEMK